MTHPYVTFAVHGVADVGWALVSGTSSTGGWFGILGGTHEKDCVLFMSRFKIVCVPNKIVIESWNTHASSFEDRERSQKDCRVYLLHSLRLTLFFFLGENGLDRARAAAVPPGLNSSRTCSDVHSRQQITNVAANSGHTAVLPLTLAPTARDQLASRFIVPPPAPQHTPSTSSFSAGSYSSGRFRAQFLKNLPETLAPSARDRIASRFIVPPSAPQYTPLTPPLSSGTYFSGHSSEKHPENCPANWKVFDNYHPISAQQLLTTPRVICQQQAAKHASPTTSRACSRRLREHTADEAPNKRAMHAPQQIVGIGAPSFVSVLRPAELDVIPVKIPMATAKLRTECLCEGKASVFLLYRLI